MSNSNVRKRLRTDEDSVDMTKPIVDHCLKMLKDQEDCDLFFIVGQERERIGAHKLILKARSGYFKIKFSERWRNDESSVSDVEGNEILLVDEEPSIFLSFLEHIYAYVFSASPTESVKLLQLANFYIVPSLIDLCEGRLAEQFQPDDVLEIFVLATKFGLTKVSQRAGETMASYFPLLVKSPTFEKIDEATLMHLLVFDDLNIRESELFPILLRWADREIENSVNDPKPERGEVLKNLIPLIRFPTMSAREFAEVVASTKILPVHTDRALLMYTVLSNEKERKALASEFVYNTIPRKNRMAIVDLYHDKRRPGRGTYPNVALKKCSNIQDTIRFSVVGWSTPIILSLVLERPKYSEPLFQNSSEAAEMNLPIRVGVSLSTASKRDGQSKRLAEEVFATIDKRQVILPLPRPWLLFDDDKVYEITVRYLSDVYVIPEFMGDSSQERTSRRDENYDFLTATALRDRMNVPFGRFCCLVNLAMGDGPGMDTGSAAGGSTAQVRATALTRISSGLHILRSIQVVDG